MALLTAIQRAAAKMGRKGGKTSRWRMTAKERSEAASHAAKARWALRDAKVAEAKRAG
jgi:hypothetical protein